MLYLKIKTIWRNDSIKSWNCDKMEQGQEASLCLETHTMNLMILWQTNLQQFYIIYCNHKCEVGEVLAPQSRAGTWLCNLSGAHVLYILHTWHLLDL